MNRKRHVLRWSLSALLVLFFMSGCEESKEAEHDFGDNNPDLFLAFGDSITRGVELPADESYPNKLAFLLGVTVINSGTPGDLSADGLARISNELSNSRPGYVLIMFGSNDIIRGRSESVTIHNLRAIVQAVKANMSIPLLASPPPAFGDYAYMEGPLISLSQAIKNLASEEKVKYVDVYGRFPRDTSLYQADGLHHNASGATVLASIFADRL